MFSGDQCVRNFSGWIIVSLGPSMAFTLNYDFAINRYNVEFMSASICLILRDLVFKLNTESIFEVALHQIFKILPSQTRRTFYSLCNLIKGAAVRFAKGRGGTEGENG